MASTFKPIPITFSSAKLGSNYNKIQFDDKDFLHFMEDIQISEVRLYDNGSYLAGIQVFYNYNGQIVTPGLYCTVNYDDLKEKDKGNVIDYRGSKINETKLILLEDEYFIDAEIRSGAIIDKLTMRTNYGNVISAGGMGGSSTTVAAEDNEHLVGFCGSFANAFNKESSWATIHQLQCHFATRQKKKKVKETKNEIVNETIDETLKVEVKENAFERKKSRKYS